jgi:hypothetical protein
VREDRERRKVEIKREGERESKKGETKREMEEREGEGKKPDWCIASS